MSQKGSCHCGRVAFEVEGDLPPAVMACNCSICQRRGSLLWFVARDQLRLATPEADLATYRFGTERIRHRFCEVCGCAPFGEGEDPKTGAKMAAVNVRCLDDIDLSAFEIKHFDGRSL